MATVQNLCMAFNLMAVTSKQTELDLCNLVCINIPVCFVCNIPFILTFRSQSTHICALKGKVEVAKVHLFVQSGI
jgi:hypothetical protein